MGSFSLEVNDSKKEVLGRIQPPRADGCTDFCLESQWCNGVTSGLFPLCPKAAAEVPLPPQAALWLGFRHCASSLNLNSVSLALLANTTYFSLISQSTTLIWKTLTNTCNVKRNANVWMEHHHREYPGEIFFTDR